MEQRDEAGHVVALEGGEVAVEQRGLVGRYRVRAGGVGERGQGGAGALQRTVDRRHAGAEEAGHLRCLPAQHLAEDEDRALPCGQVLQRGDEREAHGVPGHRDLGRVAVFGQDPRVRDRRDPQVLGQHLADVRGIRRRGRPHFHRAGAALAAPEHVQAHVGGDAVQPRAHARPAFERPEERQARSIVSWTASSASKPEPSIR